MQRWQRVALVELAGLGLAVALLASAWHRFRVAVAVPTVACVLGAAAVYGALRRRRLARRRSPSDDLELLLEEVGRRSRGVLYIVTNKTNDRFSGANLAKYLRMKGAQVHEGRTEEESLRANARLLLELLETGTSVPPASVPLRHELVSQVVSPERLADVFPAMKAAYVQQPLDYGRNSRYGDKWRISCYLVVMENWKPRIEPHPPMVECMTPVMNACTDAFSQWFCRRRSLASVKVTVMNGFVTRYRATDSEDQLEKHIDGANVDGSVILALPTDDPFKGGSLRVWDGRPQRESLYHLSPGDAVFLENAVFHQAMPITAGTRWALVLFLRLQDPEPLAGA